MLFYSHDLSYKGLAESLGVTENAIRHWTDYSTMPPITNIQKLAVFFGLSLDDFVRIDLESIPVHKLRTMVSIPYEKVA